MGAELERRSFAAGKIFRYHGRVEAGAIVPPLTMRAL
jgi:hypothetical protein